MKHALSQTASQAAAGNSYPALFLRIALGVMFLAHGLTKLLVFTPAGTAQYFASLGFPAFLGYAIIVFEITAAVFLLVGFTTRWVALLATGQMLVISWVHMGNGWSFSNAGGGWEYPAFMALTALALAFLGDGKFSFAAALRRKKLA